MKFLSIDIGGTSAKTGILNENGSILTKDSYSVCFDHYETPILNTILKETDSFLAKHNINISNLAGIGVSATGQIDTHTGTVIGSAGHIKNWIGSPIKDKLAEKYHLPVSVINDADSAAIAEQWIGAAKGHKNAIVITIGTGIGGGVIVNSSILEGKLGIAGELGHFSINNQGIPCTCGNRGCYERYASTTALIQMVREKYEQLSKPFPAEKINGRSIFHQLTLGNPIVEEMTDIWISNIADGLVSLTHIFNPEIILIGGGVSAQKKLFIDKVRQKVLRRVMPQFAEGLLIEAALLSNDAGMIGAVKALLGTG